MKLLAHIIFTITNCACIHIMRCTIYGFNLNKGLLGSAGMDKLVWDYNCPPFCHLWILVEHVKSDCDRVCGKKTLKQKVLWVRETVC